MTIGKFTCAVCGESFFSITPQHLKKHGLTRKEYFDQYGNIGLQNTDFLKSNMPRENIEIKSYSAEMKRSRESDYKKKYQTKYKTV